MAKEYELKYLSGEFYKKYNKISYPEIENKDERPYLVLLFKIDDNHFAVPFRTNMRHNYGYKFKKSDRKTDSATGLDFTKTVFIEDRSYIGADAVIDDGEFAELNKKYYFIKKKLIAYIKGYKQFLNGELNEYESKKYTYTTLKYFHKELKL